MLKIKNIRVEGDKSKLIGNIDGNIIIVETSKTFLEPYFKTCEKKFNKFHDSNITYYTGCKDITIILNDT